MKRSMLGITTFILALAGNLQSATLTLDKQWQSFENGVASYTSGSGNVQVKATGGSLFYNGTTTLGARDYLGVGNNKFNGAITYGEGLLVTFDKQVRLTSIGLSQWENGWETARISFGADSTLLTRSSRQGGLFDTRDYWDFESGLELSQFHLFPNSGLPAFYLFELGYEVIGPAEVPLPASAWLFATALLGIVTIGRRTNNRPFPA